MQPGPDVPVVDPIIDALLGALSLPGPETTARGIGELTSAGLPLLGAAAKIPRLKSMGKDLGDLLGELFRLKGGKDLPTTLRLSSYNPADEMVRFHEPVDAGQAFEASISDVDDLVRSGTLSPDVPDDPAGLDQLVKRLSDALGGGAKRKKFASSKADAEEAAYRRVVTRESKKTKR